MGYGYEEKQTLNKYFPFRAQYSESPTRMNAHWHSQIELMFFYSSDGCQYRCRSQTFNVKSGDLVIANSAELHECIDFGNSSVCCLTIDTDILAEYKGILFLNHIQGNLQIYKIFEKLKQAFNEPETFNFILASCVYEIFAILIKNYTYDNISCRKKQGYNISHQVINKILNYIENNLSEKFTTEILAAHSNLSPGRFYHVFKEITGVTPTEYIEKIRLSHAVCLLSNSDMNILEIALECGFSDQSYFSYRFKKHFNCSPKEYRRLKL